MHMRRLPPRHLCFFHRRRRRRIQSSFFCLKGPDFVADTFAPTTAATAAPTPTAAR